MTSFVIAAYLITAAILTGNLAYIYVGIALAIFGALVGADE